MPFEQGNVVHMQQVHIYECALVVGRGLVLAV